MIRNPTWMGWCVLCAAWIGGCGDDGGEVALDPDSWSGMNVNAIQKDCNETVQCMNQLGMPLVDDPINNCVRSTAQVLEASTAKQAQFISNHGRCQQFVVCEYFNCAITNATSSYGETQQAKVSQNCTAEVECLTARGTPPADPQTAISTCVVTNINVLNNFSGEMRIDYERAFDGCQALAGCEFANCFPY